MDKGQKSEKESTKGVSAPSFIPQIPSGGNSSQYDVFLSFRGLDTRKTFTDHLYHNLVNIGTVPFGVFRDDNIPIGEEFGSYILDAITRSKISIPIISENYASSKWCLRELIHIMDCNKSTSHVVLPIFYKVNPSHVRYLKGSFGEAFHSSKERFDEKDIQEGQRALSEVSYLNGWESEKFANGHEGELVKKVIKTVLGKLGHDFQLDVTKHLVGIRDHVNKIRNWVDTSTSDVRMIGIYGMGGIGKTTLAKVIYNGHPIKNAPFARRSGGPAVVAMAKPDPLRIMISGAPASGKGTQCELITKKYGLVHVAAGDLLRAEVAAGSENGKQAKEYMEKGQLVPNEIVVMMVKERLLQSDSLENGWLLDGYPRSLSQATALQAFGLQADLFILLEVPEEILVERVVGRRLDPVTGRIYHLKYSPPETEEIAARLTQRFDDTEEKVKLRLRTHHQNVEAVLSMYKDITIKVNGDAPKEDVFAQIDNALSKLLEEGKATSGSLAA